MFLTPLEKSPNIDSEDKCLELQKWEWLLSDLQESHFILWKQSLRDSNAKEHVRSLSAKCMSACE
jgi:hypothetical protein